MRSRLICRSICRRHLRRCRDSWHRVRRRCRLRHIRSRSVHLKNLIKPRHGRTAASGAAADDGDGEENKGDDEGDGDEGYLPPAAGQGVVFVASPGEVVAEVCAGQSRYRAVRDGAPRACQGMAVH